MSESTYRQELQGELARRCERNPRYSVRSFARALSLSPGALSQILAGKRLPSHKLAQRILSSLDFTSAQEDAFLRSLAAAHRDQGLKRLPRTFRKAAPEGAIRELSVDLFRIIGDWHHYAILEMTFVEGFRGDPQWIAGQLGITVTEAKLAVDRLLDLEFLQIAEDGTLTKTFGTHTTSDKHLTTPALRRHQRQVLEKAIHSLENDPIETRGMSSMTMAIDPELLPEAKRRIEEFTQELCAFLESGRRKQVYELGIAIYPIQKSKGASG
jgi:uncharacterized protein (TIGR02147 family)